MSSMREEKEWCISPSKSKVVPNWVSKVSNDLNNLTQSRATESERWKNEAIYRIPLSLKNLCGIAYQPQMVSIGPYHHGAPQLAAMEKHKHRALLNFLERSKKALPCYLDALEKEVENLNNAYDQLEAKWRDKEAFLEVMMVDGCFILELIRTAKPATRPKSYAHNDPVFSCRGHLYLAPYLRRDMLMLENQIPLQVLHIILTTAQDGALNLDGVCKQEELNLLVLEFFAQPHQSGSNKGQFGKCLHILDLYRKSLLLGHPPKKSKCPAISCVGLGDDQEADVYTRSATELIESGIRFEKSKTRSLDDITFHGGVLKLPLIVVDDAVESEFLNLMAFERFHVDAGSEVTSYVFFMDRIIDSAKDVSLLHWRGVIQNALGSDEAVAHLFNSLSREACLDHSSGLGLVHRDVVRYCRSPLPRWMAYAKHNYFTNPWVGLSVVAAIFLFALTGIQTVYTVLGYLGDAQN